MINSRIKDYNKTDKKGNSSNINNTHLLIKNSCNKQEDSLEVALRYN